MFQVYTNYDVVKDVKHGYHYHTVRETFNLDGTKKTKIHRLNNGLVIFTLYTNDKLKRKRTYYNNQLVSIVRF